MVHLKSNIELRAMQSGGEILKKAVHKLLPLIKPGVSTNYIDTQAEKLIKTYGGESSFKRVKNYRWTACLPINEQVVHTPPSERILKDGDVLTVDIGAYYKGFHTDFATSFIVGDKKVLKNADKIQNFLDIGKNTLKKAIEQAKKSTYIGEISRLIEKEIYGKGYFIMKNLTGHGIGKNLHEDPFIPGILNSPIEKTYRIRPGLAIAIEVIYSMGTEEIEYEKGSDWSILTKDRSMSACFEHTIAFFTDKTVILT